MEDQSLASPNAAFSGSEQFITQMKLRELRQQRDRLLAAYDELARDLAALPQGGDSQGEAARLRLLYDRLRSLQFARQPVHPDVANLEVLWYELERDQLSPETLSFWRARLEHELAQGRLRAEVVYIFSALLEEWTTHSAPSAEQATRQRELTNSLVSDWQTAQAAPAAQSAPFFDAIFASLNLNETEVGKTLRDEANKQVYAPVTSDDLQPILEKISRDTFRTAETRKQAQGFVENAILLKEFADALTIMIDHLDEWNWPTEGVATQAMWSNTRWRLFLTEDLPNAALLELLGNRWQTVFTAMWETYTGQRLERLKQTIPNPQFAKYLTHGMDIWAGVAAPDEYIKLTNQDDAWKAEHLADWGDYYSIITKRVKELVAIHTNDDEEDDYTGGSGEPNRMERTLALINAELALGRQAFAHKPIYVIKADLHNFYPGLSHDVLLDALTHFGLAERDLAFFRRYLRVPLRQMGGAMPLAPHTGMPNHRSLSDTLSEALLRLFDLYVESSARAQVNRLVDDICIIAASPAEAVKAWRAAQEFCQACGLAFNAEKSGSVTINGQPLADLPAGPVTWQLLTLGADGEWRVDQVAFEAYTALARERIANAESIIASAERYKAEVNYLENALAIHTPLGAVHRRSVMDALSGFHATLFGARQGIASMLFERIGERYLGASAAADATRLPEAWLYWPVTAGGLGLIQEPLRAATYAEAYAKREVTPPTGKPQSDWLRSNSVWGKYHGWHLVLIEPNKPTENTVMAALTTDFINRGASISDGKQTTLSPYWRWILSIYGPQILDAFGTFRFLFTELVPVRLLTQKYLNETEESGESSNESDIPF